MKLRKVVFWIHLTIGCTAGVVILGMCITGILLAFQRQITDFVDSDARHIAMPEGGSRLPLETVISKVSAVEGRPPNSVTVRANPNSAVELSFTRERTVFADPYSGAENGVSSRGTRAFFIAVEGWHRAVGGAFQQRGVGRWISDACNVLFFFMCLSGLYLWWPRTLTMGRLANTVWFRRGLHSKARYWNWHHVFGIWAVIPLLWITASGIEMSYRWANNLLYRATGSQPPAQVRRDSPDSPAARGAGGGRAANSASATSASLDELLSTVKSDVPGWKAISFRTSGPTISFSIDTSNGGRPETLSQLVFDGRSGAPLRSSKFADNSMGQKLGAWFRFMHTGEELGLFGQIVNSLASFAGAMLVFSGISLAVRRFAAAFRKNSAATSEKVQVSDAIEREYPA